MQGGGGRWRRFGTGGGVHRPRTAADGLCRPAPLANAAGPATLEPVVKFELLNPAPDDVPLIRVSLAPPTARACFSSTNSVGILARLWRWPCSPPGRGTPGGAPPPQIQNPGT